MTTLPRKSYVLPYVIPCNPYGKTYEISLDPVEIIGSGNPYVCIFTQIYGLPYVFAWKSIWKSIKKSDM